jgi:hypothetical protein
MITVIDTYLIGHGDRYLLGRSVIIIELLGSVMDTYSVGYGYLFSR